MPKVGNKHFPYNKAGVAAAKAAGKGIGSAVSALAKAPREGGIGKKVSAMAKTTPDTNRNTFKDKSKWRKTSEGYMRR